MLTKSIRDWIADTIAYYPVRSFQVNKRNGSTVICRYIRHNPSYKSHLVSRYPLLYCNLYYLGNSHGNGNKERAVLVQDSTKNDEKST